ncbi:3'-5' exonuclease (plasmid) [Bacillus mycoides]|uniref:3'-5' exonuclease n=1 Tax=Bacillus mycoides TaxID=1405 RepID=UPI001C013E33|nr:3'-5' exonuclease [Bacillus mycoides]QWI25661.1 3'-5' exonuclease [Bacillus mycoides]
MTTHFKNWNEIPENLATKTALGREGLKPNGNVVGTYFKRSTNKYIDLYDRNEATPKRKMSEKQQIALEKAREKSIQQRTCTRCEYAVQHKNKLENGLCSSCIKNLAEIESFKKQRESCRNEVSNFLRHKNRYLILDTQTTGLNSTDQIIEIAVIDLDGKTLLNTLVKPTILIPDNITMIHGITDEMTKKGRTWFSVYNELCDIVSNKTLLIYNAEFDLSMLSYTCYAHDIPSSSFKAECIMDLYATYIGSRRPHSLENAIGHIIPHESLDRCLALLLLMQQIQKKTAMINHRCFYSHQAFSTSINSTNSKNTSRPSTNS